MSTCIKLLLHDFYKYKPDELNILNNKDIPAVVNDTNETDLLPYLNIKNLKYYLIEHILIILFLK